MTDLFSTHRAVPFGGRRFAMLALLALTACAPRPDPVPPPTPAQRPAVIPAPSPRPEISQEQLRRERAEAARMAAARAATPASATMAQYLSGVQDSLLSRGLLRADAGTPPDAARLAEDFIQIALRDEYVMQDGRLVPQSRPAPLRRWERPVRISVVFGDSVLPAARTRDRALVADFAARLQRITGHPVGLTGSGGNFVVLFVNEDERRAIGPRLAALVPGIPPSDIRAIEGLSPQNYCTVFAYSPGAGAAYSNAVAVIRAELPERLRLSCIHEELAQGMGLANDSPDARPSIFNDDEEFAYLTAHDERLLKMLYDRRLRPGMTEAEARPIVARIAAELAPEPAPRPGA
nr:DUF2927 domain-containing protein [Paracoccus sp. MC1862]